MKIHKNKRICFFGGYNKEYPRNKVLLSGLKENGACIMECHTELLGIKKYFDLVKKHHSFIGKYDILLVPFSGWYCVILAKFLTRKPIVFDALVSIYDSLVFDRKAVKSSSIKAKYFWLIDWFSCKLSNHIILDTDEHIKYFTKEFHFSIKKFIKIPLTAIPIDRPIVHKDVSKFIVHQHGHLLPLQGLDYILEASRLLSDYEDIQFNIIGSKTKRIYDDGSLNNVHFIEDLPYQELLEYISAADVCLGIFGNTDKAKRVTSFKTFEYISMKKAVITADTLAVRELFDDNDLKLVPIANSKAIAEAILFLKNNVTIRDNMSISAYEIFKDKLTPKILTEKILDI